jgi:hypothetical protein
LPPSPADLDREPECRCVETQRGTDTLGCPAHDLDYPESEPDEALAMCEYSAQQEPASRSAGARGRDGGAGG